MAATNPNRFFIYEHWRPDRDECFYVGKGHGGRANDMRNGRNRFHKAIQGKLSRMGMCVEVKMVAEHLTESDAFALERERIAFWRSNGADLANMTDGGEGTSGYKQTPEAIAKTIALHTGRKRSDETRARISEAMTGRSNPVGIARMAEINRGKKRVFSEEHRAKIGRASKGRKMPEHVKAVLLAANTGRSFEHTEEAKAKISAARKGRKMAPISEEHKAAISVANKGKVFSEEHKANISKSRKEYYARLRENSNG